MTNNYVKFALRNFSREKTYSFLNITGLSLGIACFILLSLFLRHELSYDKHNVLQERIFRVNHEIDYGNTRNRRAQSSHYLGPLLQAEYPQIESYASFRPLGRSSNLLKFENNSYYIEDIYIADNTAFDIFTHEIVYGNPDQALTRPNTIAINETLANLFFADENPVGKTLSTGVADYQISLVFADLPDNSHFKYQALVANLGIFAPTANGLENFRGNLWNLNSFNYVLMHEGYQEIESHQEMFIDFFDRVMAQSTRAGYQALFYLEPLTGIHLNSVAQRDLPRGSIFYLYAFTAVAAFVLLIACINYINLATARAVKRRKEISIRKVLGADRSKLVIQFLFESIVYSLLSLAIAISIVELILIGSTEINLLGKELSLSLFQDGFVFLSLISMGLVIGIGAGIYPALHLANIDITAIELRGWHKSISSRVREGLVLLQFTVSITVITATILMYSQMRYIDSKPLGFEKQNKLVVRVQGSNAIEDIAVLVEQLKSHPQIHNASMVTGNPITSRFSAALEALREDGTVYNLDFHNIGIDANFIDTLGINLVAGRDFEPGAIDAQRYQVIINEATAKEVGWNDPIGMTYSQGGGNIRTVVGVVEDFHFENMHAMIEPFVFFYDIPDFEGMNPLLKTTANRELIIDISDEFLDETLGFIQDTWQAFEPTYPLQYEYLDRKLSQMYDSDNRQMTLIGIFALICISISCLGLFGLTAFTNSQKTKEIGIRKTLGASTQQILFMLFRGVLMLLLIASPIAAIISYLATSGWIESFYYREAINPMAFVFAAGVSIVIAFATVAIQSSKTAGRNPVEALRYE
ncbi:MAG: hypothetical protein COB20_12600 [SAR86 cluster bacterium]|uniref:ABC transporter permease n=1 Tax=SAR86 cluster bacterium TaxID=2030880 RepID=A0A2A4X0F5_9GAMM|nr:MAG: hypothetical protein COB20_12600 [SAR86 cluster bacterium]